jgi:hypothetical protein
VQGVTGLGFEVEGDPGSPLGQQRRAQETELEKFFGDLSQMYGMKLKVVLPEILLLRAYCCCGG